MCYSAMVEQSWSKLEKRFNARIDFDRYEEAFLRRRDGEKLILPRGMEVAFSADSKSRQEKAIAQLIAEWHAAQIQLRETDLFKQSKRLADAERKLLDKETKKALNDQRIASNKIPWLKDKIKWHYQNSATDSDYRIFPQHWLSMVYTDDIGNPTVGPFRYHLRPAWADESWDRKRDGSYNARRDSLRNVWKNQFGAQHGLILVKRFWENVSPEKYRANTALAADLKAKENIVIQFEPDDNEWMVIPTIYDVWERKNKPTVFSTALITDDPLDEIAEAGHDRTPISLNATAAQRWLSPQSSGKDVLFALLDDIKRPFYEHAVAA